MENDQTSEALREVPKSEPVPHVPGNTVRTYASDVADAMRRGQGSMVKIALAEQARREDGGEDVADKATSRKFIALSIGLIALGIIIAVVAIIATKKKPVTVVTNVPPPMIITLDDSRRIDITGMTRTTIKSRISDALVNAAPRLNTIQSIVPVEQSGETYTEVSTERFLTLIESAMPSALRRTLSPHMVFGVHAFNGNGPFLLLTTDSYATAFDAMLTYERVMFDEFYDVFGLSATDYRYLFTSQFQDKVIRNQDTRALLSPEGKPVFFYTFLGEKKNVILIATKESTVEEVVRRLRGVAGN
jgi:hypothetical protein